MRSIKKTLCDKDMHSKDAQHQENTVRQRHAALCCTGSHIAAHTPQLMMPWPLPADCSAAVKMQRCRQ
jgi:hypothetical protein